MKTEVKFAAVLFLQLPLLLLANQWREGVAESDSAFWAASKNGRNMMQLKAKADVENDIASNVRAEQGDDALSCSKKVYIRYDAVSASGTFPVNVDVVVKDKGVVVPATSFSGDYGQRIPQGRNKLIIWDAGVDYDNKRSSDMTVDVTAVPADNPSTWAVVTISWASFGGRDLDVCGYWLDRPDVKVGWSYSTGSESSTFRSTWRGDNTGSGPEYINIGVVAGEVLEGVSRRAYRIHCNYYGAAGSSSKATISVSCNGQSMSKTIGVSNRNRSKALTSDPYVTIYFDESGALTSIQ